MSQKLFTLLFGDQLRIKPNSKIIKAKTLSQVLSAKQMLEHVQQEEKKYRKEIISECEQIKEQAYREGFESGYKQWAQQLSFLEEEILKVRKELEKILTPIALAAAKKILGRELTVSPDSVVDIVTNVLKSVSQHKKITVYTNPKDLEVLETHRPKLKEIFESLEALSLRPREDIQSGGCVIETEGGIISAQLENQWKVLEQAFKSMLTGDSLDIIRNNIKAVEEGEQL